jgi:uncharacterized protein
MSGLTLKPVLGCNFSCTGCYEGEIFKANGNKPEPYNIEAILRGIENGPGGQVTFHGGEITLMPVADMVKICEKASALGRPLGMQTNGSILTDRILDMLVTYRVGVGVSINGPGDLNRDRRVLNAKQIDITDKMTERIHANIDKMRGAEVSVSLITVLSRTNAGTPERVERLLNWAISHTQAGSTWHRFNPLFMDGTDCISGADNAELTNEELSYVWRKLANACFSNPKANWNPFREMVDNLWGLGVEPCWFGTCDVYNTEAVYSVLHDGSNGNCLRTAKDGISYQRASERDHTRQSILAQLPQEQGGCKDCKWWTVCHGGCPAEANDWREKTRFCQATIELYQHIEDKLVGLIPNFTSRVNWTTNDPDRLQNMCESRTPDISPVNPTRPDWSRRPSTYRQDAREQR